MKQGYNRFVFWLNQLSELMKSAREQENPAMWLFRNNARTPFFMLEALSRLYGKIDDHKNFKKPGSHFKLAEDKLGVIDYYNWLNDALAMKEVDDRYKQFIRGRLDDAVEDSNKLLLDKEWISPGEKRISKINKRLKHADWPGSKKEINCLASIYKAAIKDISRFVAERDFRFDNVEEDVHELRRRLRWLSIYPQALRGAIRYAPDSVAASHLEKYLTPAVVNSPYNKLPESDDIPVMLVDKNYFLALSWMIAQLGDLKDEGLLITGLAEAVSGTENTSSENALSKATALMGMKENAIDNILRSAEEITRVYFNEKNLTHLVAGTKTK